MECLRKVTASWRPSCLETPLIPPCNPHPSPRRPHPSPAALPRGAPSRGTRATLPSLCKACPTGRSSEELRLLIYYLCDTHRRELLCLCLSGREGVRSANTRVDVP